MADAKETDKSKDQKHKDETKKETKKPVAKLDVKKQSATKKTVAKKPEAKKTDAKQAPVLAGKQKIRIRLKSYDHKIIDQSAKQIVDTALRTGATIAGPIPLPTRKTKFTVVKSPHVFKKGREQFEMRVHKRLIDVFEPTPKTIDSLMNLSLPAGCDAEIKM